MSSSQNPVFRQAFIDGVTHTLQTMGGAVVKYERPMVRVLMPTNGEACIAGTIEVNEKNSTCHVSVCFPESTFRCLMSKILSEELDGPTSAYYDGASEMINIIFGHAKRTLNSAGHSIELALPRIIIGQSYRIPNIDDATTTIIPFNGPLGNFHLTISKSYAKETDHV